mmetsp:Transcript_70610/g.103490  ORF Transcript_70610/g.103490 Transcript_70610/m.103490 type:complete len:108 (+) Transcript_70610:45-368(+)
MKLATDRRLHAAFVVYLLLRRERARQNDSRAKHRDIERDVIMERDRAVESETEWAIEIERDRVSDKKRREREKKRADSKTKCAGRVEREKTSMREWESARERKGEEE